MSVKRIVIHYKNYFKTGRSLASSLRRSAPLAVSARANHGGILSNARKPQQILSNNEGKPSADIELNGKFVDFLGWLWADFNMLFLSYVL